MDAHPSLFFSPFRLELGNDQLWKEETVVPLRRKTLAVLRYLVEHAGQLVTKEHVLAAVWPGTYVEEGALTICIAELRKVLGDDAKTPRFIGTVHGRGYRFLPTVATQPVASRPHSVVKREEENRRTKSEEQKAKINSEYPASNTRHPTPVVVGREAECAFLHDRLEKVLSGERPLVFVTGEPGIGKTTLIEAFLSSLGQKATGSKQKYKPMPVPWIAWGQCIEQHGAGEAFLPILDALGRLCRGPHGDELIALLRRHAPMWLVQLPAFLAAEELATLQQQGQGASRERMLREMAETLEVLTAQHPLLLVLEDLHWSDVSTLDLLAFMARRKEPARLLIIGSYRPIEMLSDGHPLKSVTQELYGHQLAAELSPQLLNETDIAVYLKERFGAEAQRAVPLQAFVRTLHRRTGGNPLFLVSLVNDLFARGSLTQTKEGWTVQDHINPDDIPDTIRYLVARQRERLSLADQRLLEAASAARWEFSAAAVAAALGKETPDVEQQCERLAARQQFLRRVGVAEWPDGTLAAHYSFLHALYQQLWHERVSPLQLQSYHLRIGKRKEQAYGERAREIAVELAVHFEQGREYRKAVRYLQLAGENAFRRSANVEAVSYFTRALELLKILPDTPEGVQQELMLQLALGPPLAMTKGNAAWEVGHVYARAHELAQHIGEIPQLLPALAGLWGFYQVRGEFLTARELGEQRLRLAQMTQDSTLLLVAHHAMGETLLRTGEFVACQEHLEQGMALYNPQRHRTLAFLSGFDPGMGCRDMAAISLWFLGYSDQALTRSQEALTLGHELSHPFSLGHALAFAAFLHLFRREGQLAQEKAEAMIALASKHEFAWWLAGGMMLRGWALVEQGQIEEGIAQLRQGLAAGQATGAALERPVILAVLAETHGKTGHVKEGLQVLEEATTVMCKTGQRNYEAELYRLKGELIAQKFQVPGSKLKVTEPRSLMPDTRGEAEAYFYKAIEIARKQQAKSLELRATVSRARLWQQQGKTAEARQILAEIYNWFTEGFDTKDLQEAKVLLEELT